MQIETRKSAVLNGHKTFYTGKACKHGHLTFRYTVNGCCSECVNPRIADYTSPEIAAAKSQAEDAITQAGYEADALRSQADAIEHETALYAAKLIQDARDAAVSAYKSSSMQRLQEVALTRQSRERMTLRGFRLYENQVAEFLTHVVTHGHLINAGLSERDLFPSAKGTKKDGLTAWYKFYCADEHYDILLQISNIMLTSPSL